LQVFDSLWERPAINLDCSSCAFVPQYIRFVKDKIAIEKAEMPGIQPSSQSQFPDQ
jgi:hypothetical protein